MKPPSKILIVKLCCIGDVVFLSPMLRQVRRSYPGVQICYLASSWVGEIVRQIPSVDEVIPYDAPLQRGVPWWKKAVGTLRLVQRLRRERFDVAIIGHRNLFFAILCRLGGIRRRVGFGKGVFLTDGVPFEAGKHEVDRYFDLLAPLGIPGGDAGTEIHPPEDEVENVRHALQRWNVDSGDILIGILAAGGENPGTRMPIKRWNPGFYASLCARLVSEFSARILLVGGPADREYNQKILDQVPGGEARITNIAGDLPLRALPALLQRLRLVIGGDSGPMHLAAAVRTPTLFLFGPSDPRLVAPRQPNSIFLWKSVYCSPCYTPETVMDRRNYRDGEFPCRTGTHECLESLSVGEVFRACGQLISSDPS